MKNIPEKIYPAVTKLISLLDSGIDTPDYKGYENNPDALNDLITIELTPDGEFITIDGCDYLVFTYIQVGGRTLYQTARGLYLKEVQSKIKLVQDMMWVSLYTFIATNLELVVNTYGQLVFEVYRLVSGETPKLSRCTVSDRGEFRNIVTDGKVVVCTALTEHSEKFCGSKQYEIAYLAKQGVLLVVNNYTDKLKIHNVVDMQYSNAPVLEDGHDVYMRESDLINNLLSDLNRLSDMMGLKY